MHADDLKAPEAVALPVAASRQGADSPALAIHAAVTAVVGFAVTLVWGLTGFGYFWPMWVWFGICIPLAFHGTIRSAIRSTTGRRRGLAVHGAVSGVLGAITIIVWKMSNGSYFWPVWPLFGLSVPFAIHALVVAALGRFAPAGRERVLVERVDELTRTRRGALDVQAAELRRIERDLHDGAQARLVALSMQLGRAEERLAGNPEAADLVRRARGEASAAIAELRDLARGIAPPVLADRGLAAAVEALGRRVAMPVSVETVMDRRPPPVIETAAYFVVAESLTNVAKHAPDASVGVTLLLDDTQTPSESGTGERLIVEVADDGPGGADPGGGGLTGLRHRVEALDGTLRIASSPDHGTTIRADLPCG